LIDFASNDTYHLVSFTHRVRCRFCVGFWLGCRSLFLRSLFLRSDAFIFVFVVLFRV